MNYYLEDLCCFCLSSLSNSNEKYRDGSRESPDTTTHFDKLKTTLIELSTVLETDSRLCKKCCETIDFIYDFNKTCLKNIKILSSYKNILKENLTKKQCNLYVDLNKSNQYNQTAISSTIVKMEPLESTFDNVDNNLSENYLNESVEVKEEIGTQCESNETFETCWLVPEIKMEAEEIESEEERTNEIDEQMDDESLKPNIQENIKLTISEQNATNNLLPTKSKTIYEKEFSNFNQWRQQNNITSIDETILLAYFQELSKEYRPSSLWTKHSILKSTLNLHHKTDISSFSELNNFLRSKSKNYMPKKSKVLTGEQMLKFIKNAPDNVYLFHKIVLIMFIFGDLKRDEMAKMRFYDIKDNGSVITVNIPGKTKYFTIVEESEIDALKLIRKYISLRPPSSKVDRFFLNLKNGICTIQPVGKNKIGSVPKSIAEYLHLDNPELYTFHSLLLEAGSTFETLKIIGKLKSDAIGQRFIEESLVQQNKIANIISNATCGGDASDAGSSTPSNVDAVFNTLQFDEMQQ